MRTLRWTLATFVCAPWLLLVATLRRPVKHKVLVVQLGKIGDLLCTTPLMRAIKTAHPTAEIHVLCLERCQEVLAHNPHVSTLHCIDIQSRRALFARLHRERFEVVINTLPSTIGAMTAVWASAPLRINTSSSAHGVLVKALAWLNTSNIAYRIRTRTFDHYMNLAAAMGVSAVPYKIDFVVIREVEESMTLWMNEHELHRKEFVILSLTAGNSVKEWPEEKFAQLADHITQHMDKHVVLSTLDADVAKRTMEKCSDQSRIVDGSDLSLAALGALCKSAAAFVSVDTGPMYIAYALHCPVVIIVGPVHPAEQIPPEGECVAHVLPPQGCVPWVFISLTPREGTQEQLNCARETKVEDVITALHSLCSP